MWLTSNHMFGLVNFWDKSPSWVLKILKLPSFYSEISKFSKMRLVNLSQIALPYMWLPVQMPLLVKEEVKEDDTFTLSPKHQNLIVPPKVSFSVTVESKRAISENQESNGIITLYWKCEIKNLSLIKLKVYNFWYTYITSYESKD